MRHEVNRIQSKNYNIGWYRIIKIYLSSYNDWKYILKVAVIDMRYFARSKFSMSLVLQKNFSLIWQVVFKLGYAFCQER